MGRYDLLAFAIFALSRLFVLYQFELYVSDTTVYHYVATNGIQHGLKAYQDFFFPYPPIALLLMYLPVWLGGSVESFLLYRFAFQKQMFLIEFALFTWMFFWIRKIFPKRESLFFEFSLLYSLCGLFQGHLLFDRIDLGVALCLFGSVVLLSKHAKEKSAGLEALWGGLGTLYKMMPILFWAVVGVPRWVAKPMRKAIEEGLLFVSVLGLILFGYNSYTNGGLFRYLGEHGLRGIQVESIWATPWMLWKTYHPESSVRFANTYGAHHLEGIPVFYVWLSKTAGWVVFVLILGLWAQKMRPLLQRGKRVVREVSPELAVRTVFLFTLVFLVTQRVLSPQFMIWLMPLASLYVVLERRALPFWLTVWVFGLTYVGFDIGFGYYLTYYPPAIWVYGVRNALLLGLTAEVGIRWWKAIDDRVGQR